MDGRQEAESDPTRAAAAYVADITADLARLARANDLHTLGYLLEMAQLEAQQSVQRVTSGSQPSRPAIR